MLIVGNDPAIKAPNVVLVLAISAYWLFATPAPPPYWMIAGMAWVGLVWLTLTLVPGNALRIAFLPGWKERWRALARRRRTFGLMAGLWFFGHYNLGVKFVRATEGSPAKIQQRLDPMLDNGQIAAFIFLILFITSYGWAQRLLRSDWRRLHSLAWLVLPLILVHSLSIKWELEKAITTVSLAILTALFCFAAYEAVQLFKRNHPDRWRHIAMIAVGTGIALYYRFLFR